ncbi:acyl-ACP--UDP-N-acetylglucosamine O-acyltransferase [Enterobacteriaceae bacterium H11S18]|uniref:acyl-ACP--UDP-N-acetylglucosamine O-acyltransferase n=1 Tax=Dryocola clanedunensis TaxID=2925396 RepID=UPI0022F023B3|nr:acyl-ACP--UDP-N-acetylglucosamine O-acyltransferase [Dryocola clanedunensis]MCT4705971.1 acyl-ACP--UDP-N-acetylglucosamine O-acyltransferase [Dryocola clanedunensis]MCT4710538.1 acyl-ACP--UDP-N-acetylglucosamine O-acyltransferase [Dryocola clanedunensis]
MSISPLAWVAGNSVVEPGVVLGAHVTIGPYCVITAGVVIGEGTVIASHSVITGLTTIGRNNTFGQYASIGEVNQDLKYAGEPTTLVIGDRNHVGKHATFHRGTVQGISSTIVGSDNHFLNNVHIGHDCVVGDRTRIGDNSGLAGHVELADGVEIGFMCAIHQFCMLGMAAKIIDQSAVVQDVPPFVIASGNRAAPAGINEAAKAFLALELYQQLLIFQLYERFYHQALSIDEVKATLKAGESDYPIITVYNEFFARSARGIIR